MRQSSSPAGIQRQLQCVVESDNLAFPSLDAAAAPVRVGAGQDLSSEAMAVRSDVHSSIAVTVALDVVHAPKTVVLNRIVGKSARILRANRDEYGACPVITAGDLVDKDTDTA